VKIRLALPCFPLILVLALLIPSSGVLADDVNVTEGPDVFTAAGIEPGEPLTIYYKDNGEIDRIVKGVPKGVKVGLEVAKEYEAPSGARGSYDWIAERLKPGNPRYRGPTRYCDQIYYRVQISANCQTWFGMYNTGGNYSVGTYVGPYDESTEVDLSIYAWDDNWKDEIAYWGPLTNNVNGFAYY